MFGLHDFRGFQADVIETLAQGRDALVLMPTGGGKSLCYQIPALMREGVTIVVSPLIALMADQVAGLEELGISAAYLNSALSWPQQRDVQRQLAAGSIKLLYVAPERLVMPATIELLKRIKIGLFAIDEAHCVSMWGHDFRPEYGALSILRELWPEVPRVALTATADLNTRREIVEKLLIDPKEFVASFDRPNIRYRVAEKGKPAETLRELVDFIKEEHAGDTGIVYCMYRATTEDVANTLCNHGIRALAYHGGMSHEDRTANLETFLREDGVVMVATIAFGMGIDKPDVRVVVHMDLPDSVEAYFQEAGRGGRDGKPAYAVLLYNRSDHGKMLRRIPETFPTKEYIADVYDKLAYFFQLAVGDGMNVNYEFNLQRFCVNFKLFPVPVLSALRILTQAGYIDFREEEENTSRLLFLTGRDDLYRLHQLQGAADRVIKGVLRLYGGIFSDYVPIDEQRLGAECEMTPQEVYDALVLLTKLRIIHYIPHKNVPHITYLQRRVERATLSQEVYEERRYDYLRRINAILNYAEKDDRCRSRILLDYFGETKSEDCGHCDVCVERRKEKRSLEEVCHMIETMMADGRPRQVDEFCSDRFSKEKVAEALQYLTDEEILTSDDGFYRMVEGESR